MVRRCPEPHGGGDYLAGHGTPTRAALDRVMQSSHVSLGPLLQAWRRRRHLSQLNLASEAGVSQRHLSFVESGRSVPSREMLLRLAEHLAVPMRERNTLLLAAGYAPVYRERELGDPHLAPARAAVELILAGHAPHPALAVDRRWTLVAANKAVAALTAEADPSFLAPPVNVLRLSLHPRGLASRVVNYRAWRAHVLARLKREIDASGAPDNAALLEEIKAYPAPAHARPHSSGHDAFAGIAVPFVLRTAHGTLAFLTTTTVFGTALDLTLADLTIETFFPADPETAAIMRRLGETSSTA